MADYNPTFQSPIAAPERAAAESGRLRLADVSGAPVISMQGDVSAALQTHVSTLPANPGDVVAAGDGLLARLTPTELILFGTTAGATLPAAGALGDPPNGYATDVTHGQAVLKLAGPDAAEALSKICGLDFYPTVFPSMQAKQTSAAKTKTLVVRCDEGEMPVYYLLVARPFGRYFWDILWDAGQEFGMGGG